MGAGLQRAVAAAKATQSKVVRLTAAERAWIDACIRIALEDGSIYGDDSHDAETDAMAEAVRAKLRK